jgi:hypothetical protein
VNIDFLKRGNVGCQLLDRIADASDIAATRLNIVRHHAQRLAR